MNLWWRIAVALTSVISVADAGSITVEIVPGHETDTHLAFAIVSKRLPTGDAQFTVRIANNPPNAPARFVEFPPKEYRTVLGTYRVVPFDRGEEYQTRIIRSLVSEREGDAIKCLFVATKEELENPHLVFSLIDIGESSADWWFFHPQKFLKP